MEGHADAMRELHDGDRAGLDVLGIEDREVVAVLRHAVDEREQVAVAFGRIRLARSEQRFLHAGISVLDSRVFALPVL